MNIIDDVKAVAEMVYYIVASIAVVGAAYTYYRNSRLEQSRWASTFYEKFYESDRYKDVRDKLDCPTDLNQVDKLVDDEAREFTDYLNFFEHVAIFTRSKQLNRKDVEDSFAYYLNCLAKLDKVRNYINDEEKGYEKLGKFLEDRKKKNWYEKVMYSLGLRYGKIIYSSRLRK